jgi:hypothetical protein
MAHSRDRRRLLAAIHTAAAAVVLLAAAGPARAKPPELWLSPADDVTQHGADFHRFFDEPASWAATARRISVFAIPAHHLLRAPKAAAQRELDWLRGHGIKLALSLPVVAVDKHICGDGIEGMIWPGEAALAARRLKELGAEVDFFALDLPLTAGHLSTKAKACHLTVQETAIRVAASVRGLRQVYPQAKIIDIEVPTGMPLSDWSADLSEWLAAYRNASGADFSGLTMDVWWKFRWQDTVRETARILAAANIPAGILIDSTGRDAVSAQDWIADAKTNACALQAMKLRIDYVVVANWLDMQVRNLPEREPDTLTGLLNWFVAGAAC